MRPDRLPDELFAVSQWATIIYLGLIAMMVVRLEVLKRQKRLPPNFATVMSPLRWKTGFWAKIMGEAQRERQGRLLRMLFTDQHMTVGDPWVTGLVYVCRAVLVGVIALVIAEFGLMARR